MRILADENFPKPISMPFAAVVTTYFGLARIALERKTSHC
jgi:hypothetical protein